MTDTKDAMELFREIIFREIKKLERLTAEQIKEFGDQIFKIQGDRALAIYLAKTEGWWPYDNETTCQQILEAPGNQAVAIYLAKKDGWWFNQVKPQ